MKKLLDIFVVIRPVNVILAAISVLIGYFFGSGEIIGRTALYACVSAACICAGGNVFNDFFDIAIDRINKPNRPFADGRLQKRDMIFTGFVLYSAGFLLSFFVGYEGIVIAFTAIAGLTYYNIKAKRAALFGNALISVLSALTFLYGAAAGGNVTKGIIPALFAGVFHFGRELLKDIEDRDGDRQMNIVTFPVRFGVQPALNLAAVTYGVLALLTLIPFLLLSYSIAYLIIVLLGVDFLILILVTRYWISRKQIHLKQTNSLLKAGMFFGILALVLK